MLPFWTSFLVRTYAWIFLLRDTGLINTALQALGIIHTPLPLLYNDGAVLLGLVYGYLALHGAAHLRHAGTPRPFAGRSRRRPRARGPLTTVFRVIVPLSRPGIVAGSVLVFIPCLGAYLTPDLLGGGRTVLVGNLVQNQFTTARDWPFGSAVSIALMVLVTIAPGRLSAARKRAARMKRWLGLYAVAFFAFLHLPLLTLAVFSFNSSRFTIWEHFSLEWYGAIFRDPQILEGTWNSVVIALWATVLSTVIGTLCAYGLWKRDSRTLTGALYLSLVTPEIVTGISLLALFQWAFRWLHWQLGLYTVVLAHVAFCIAYVVIVVSARLRTVSPALEEAAMDLGANDWQAFWYVTLPALAPGIVAAALLALTVSFDDYVITSMVAGVDSETLPMVIYAMARRGASPVINAISALITVIFGVLILISERMRET